MGNMLTAMKRQGISALNGIRRHIVKDQESGAIAQVRILIAYYSFVCLRLIPTKYIDGYHAPHM